jgi:hypothetical protein
VNTFEGLIGTEIREILRVDIREDYEDNFPLAIFIQFDSDPGLLIGVSYDSQGIIINRSTPDVVCYDYGTEYNETCLNKLKPSDELNNFLGKRISSIKAGQFHEDKFRGENFVVKQGVYAGIIIEAANQKLTFYYDKPRGHILINSDLLFPHPENWTLT